MDNALLRLMELVPPPAEPLYNKGDWASVEIDIGFVFPQDYKDFIANYGSGTLVTYFYIPSPFNTIHPFTKEGKGYRGYIDKWIENVKDMDSYGTRCGYGFYPDPSGLIPCATYGDLDTIFWMYGNSDCGPNLIYRDVEEGYISIGPMSLTAFFLAAIEGHAPLPEFVIGNHAALADRQFIPC